MIIRKFNQAGIEQFRDNLSEIKSGNKCDLEKVILESSHLTETIDQNLKLESKLFTSKSEMIHYLHKVISQISNSEVYYDVGLWSWISAFYFDSVCPVGSDGIRKPGALNRHILEVQDWRKYYRHLLAAPVRILNELQTDSKIYLTGAPNKHGDLFEQLASRQEIATNRGVIEAATILYWDASKSNIKKGARAKNGAGILRRFTGDIIPQYQMTYDLSSMSGREIVDLLPAEFDIWKT